MPHYCRHCPGVRKPQGPKRAKGPKSHSDESWTRYSDLDLASEGRITFRRPLEKPQVFTEAKEGSCFRRVKPCTWLRRGTEVRAVRARACGGRLPDAILVGSCFWHLTGTSAAAVSEVAAPPRDQARIQRRTCLGLRVYSFQLLRLLCSSPLLPAWASPEASQYSSPV